MGFFKKTDYEKHSNNLNKKLTKIINTMDSRELKDTCQKVIGKSPKAGTRIFDADYNLIKKFGYNVSYDEYMLFFSHFRKQGKFSDLKLAKFLVLKEILDVEDKDFQYLKQFAKSEDELDYSLPRNNFSKKVKDAIRMIQKGRCAIKGCHNSDFFEFDHIRGRDDNSLSNCQMLCMYHHQVKTNEDAIKGRIEKDMNDGKTIYESVNRIQNSPKKISNSNQSHPRHRTGSNRRTSKHRITTRTSNRSKSFKR